MLYMDPFRVLTVAAAVAISLLANAAAAANKSEVYNYCIRNVEVPPSLTYRIDPERVQAWKMNKCIGDWKNSQRREQWTAKINQEKRWRKEIAASPYGKKGSSYRVHLARKGQRRIVIDRLDPFGNAGAYYSLYIQLIPLSDVSGKVPSSAPRARIWYTRLGKNYRLGHVESGDVKTFRKIAGASYRIKAGDFNMDMAVLISTEHVDSEPPDPEPGCLPQPCLEMD